jgi:hypothetical protein
MLRTHVAAVLVWDFSSMKIDYTQKLYFGKFCYKICVEVRAHTSYWWQIPTCVQDVVTWCEKNLPVNTYKVQRRRQTWDENNNLASWHVCVYCGDMNIRDQVLQHFGSQVVRMSQPLDDQHKQNLTVKNVIQIRDSLIFNKFRHAVYFKYDRSGKLLSWLKNYFQDNPKAKVSGNLWWVKVYMTDDLDVTSLQLSWPDQIDYVKTVRLLRESV